MYNLYSDKTFKKVLLISMYFTMRMSQLQFGVIFVQVGIHTPAIYFKVDKLYLRHDSSKE